METEDKPMAVAQQDENSFSKSAAESPGFPPRVESPPAQRASAPSPTINTKEAMAEVMAMFGSLPCQLDPTAAAVPEILPLVCKGLERWPMAPLRFALSLYSCDYGCRIIRWR